MSSQANILYNALENYTLKILPHLTGSNEFIKYTIPNVMFCISQHLEAGQRLLWILLWVRGNQMHRNDSFTMLRSIIIRNHQWICQDLWNCYFDPKCVRDCEWVKMLTTSIKQSVQISCKWCPDECQKQCWFKMASNWKLWKQFIWHESNQGIIQVMYCKHNPINRSLN